MVIDEACSLLAIAALSLGQSAAAGQVTIVEAIELGRIESWELVALDEESAGGFDILLITRYRDEAQYQAAEENFQALIAGSGGMSLRNELEPGEFRRSLYRSKASSLAGR